MNQPLSYVHPEAKIADNVVIEPFVTVAKDVVIGEGTWIGPNVVIMEGARVGKNCKIFPGAVIAGIPQDLKFRGEKTTAEIGDNTTIRECSTINRGTASKGKTIIGKDCLIMAYGHIAHDCTVGNGVIIGNSVGLAGEVFIDDFAIVSAMSGVHQFVHIGSHTFIQAMSGVGKDVPPFIKAGREPLSYAGINSIGLRRRGFSNEKINEIQEIYRMIYQRGMNNSDAVDFIETNLPVSIERDEIIQFVRNSKRGILRGYFDDDED